MSLKDTDHYISLITPFHRQRENFTSMVQAMTSVPVGISTFLVDLPRQFDLDEAIGVQLDIVGKWVGRDRFVPYPLDNAWFSFDDVARGFDLAAWKGPFQADLGQYRLDDTLYRRLLYAKIGANYWDGTTDSAEQILLDFYAEPTSSPGSRFFLEARGDKSATFAVAGKHPAPLVLAMMSWQAVPIKVAGEIMRSMVVSVTDSAFFGFDVNNQNVKGFNQGVWGVHPLTVMNVGNPGILDFSDPANSGLIGALT